jgi:serine/threonine-protein kinase
MADPLLPLEELFNAALDVPPAERERWLQAHSPDVELRRSVAALLDSHEQAFRYFDDLAAEVARDATDEVTLAARAESRIGSYRLLEELGRGGMGVVYLAERVDGQFERQVAIKLIRRGSEDALAVQRFLAERQILARLDHPNIARLYDGGLTDDGRPYLVMERIEGMPLDRYCDLERLTVEERLQVFLVVCAAVQFAHRNLIIHRDLKPSNLLVTAEGTVKLVDFGIAKLLDPLPHAEDDPSSPAVRHYRALTPEYAAPEQILGEAVTTATDVYALGVLLYELLTGRRPLDLGGKSPSEVERLLVEEIPKRPSEVMASTGSLLARARPEPRHVARATRPGRLRRKLRGDLDRIVLMALRKEPERRYTSVDQMAQDVRRSLAKLPVLATPDRLGYRCERFVRRNAVAFAVTVSAALLVIAFAVSATLQSMRIAREKDRAEQVSELLVELFELADPERTAGQTVTAREILDRGAGRVAERVDDPVVRSQLLDLMGRVYKNLGLYDQALGLMEESLALRRTRVGEPAVADSLGHLAALHQQRGEYQEAAQRLEEALELNRRLGDHDGVSFARLLDQRGLLRLTSGDYQAAEADLLQSLALRRRFGDLAAVAESSSNLGGLYFTLGRSDEAAASFRESLDLRRRLLGTEHPAVAATLNNLAAVYARGGNWRAAEPLYREALERYRKLLGDEHPRVATSVNNLALLYYETGDDEAALPLFRESLALRRRLLSPEHPEIAQSLTNLGLLLQRRGELEEAEGMLREALEIRRRSLGEDHPNVFAGLNNLALALAARGELAEAEALLVESLRRLRAQLGEEHPLVAINLSNLASVLHQKGDRVGAEELYRRSLELRRATLPNGHPHLAFSLLGLGRLLHERGEEAAAAALLREAVAVRAAVLPNDHPLYREVEQALLEVTEARAAERQD